MHHGNWRIWGKIIHGKFCFHWNWLIYLWVDVHMLSQADNMTKRFIAQYVDKGLRSFVRPSAVDLKSMNGWVNLKQSKSISGRIRDTDSLKHTAFFLIKLDTLQVWTQRKGALKSKYGCIFCSCFLTHACMFFTFWQTIQL